MPYCPRCRCEYNVGVTDCIDCRVPLIAQRPRRRSLVEFDADELIVPLGSFFCMLGGLALFGVTMLARDGRLSEPIGSMIASQPVCLNVFYAAAAILSGIVFAISLIRWAFFR